MIPGELKSEPDLWYDDWTESDREAARNLQGPIWVVGASGFIGAKLFFSLARIRADVYAVSRHVEGSWRLLHCPYTNRLSLDVTVECEVMQAVERGRPRTIFNLSAYGAYERQSNVQQIHRVNFEGTLHLIQALQEHGCDAFVQAGTSSEYGLNCAGPAEDARLVPNSDYAVSKAAVSHLIHYYGTIKNFPCAHLRLYSIYGPWEERDRLVPTIIRLGMRGEYPPFVNASISRDFVHVDDCNRAFVLAANTACKSKPGRIYNIASGRKTTLRETAQLSKHLFSISREPTFDSMPNRKWDLAEWYGKPDRAQAELGWSSRISFAQGLANTAEWEVLAEKHIRFGVTPKKVEKLSAIVACYRDHEAIPLMHERLTKVFSELGVDYEIIFVNDNSPTSDEHVIQKLCETDPHVLGISHARNFGSQSAFLSGMEVANGNAVILLDGDLQDTPETIPDFFDQWKKGFDVVYGVRVKREADLHMQFLYKLFYRVFKHLSDIPIPVDAGDFSLIDRRVVDHLLKLPEHDVFLRGLRSWVGFRQVGVPYERPERAFGKTTNSFFKNIWWAKKAIFSFSQKPLQYIQAAGLILFVASAAASVVYLVNYFIHRPPADARGITTIILLTLGLGSVQILSLSIIGDYLGKVLEEAKRRPRYIRSFIFKGDTVYASQEAIDSFVASNRGAVGG
jgi:nucleoside-diphosphate-sugar epimerase/glycosyltransferase involved in cell wall biosynthesis